ncbi:MAG TPA: TraR/DksA family transcriptional regulator [Macromonas sp.]|nr:TraR/DksA family transcriptional regulator [Macromonas sp.]
MSENISDTFGQQLRQMRTELLTQLRAQRGGKVGRAEAADDRHDVQSGDWFQNESQRDLSMTLDERETAELSAIDAALERIAAGSYGQCSDCGVDIPTARLHANPTALRCLACQDKQEHARGGVAHPSL